MSLFQSGNFTLSSGKRSDLKIDCDALTDEDIETLAYLIYKRLSSSWHGATASHICPVPTGGDRLASALGKRRQDRRYVKIVHGAPVLIVDDVFTTGRSMEAERLKHPEPVRGVVIFARAPCPTWITPLFQFAGNSPA